MQGAGEGEKLVAGGTVLGKELAFDTLPEVQESLGLTLVQNQ